jgi:hypothetical protein
MLVPQTIKRGQTCHTPNQNQNLNAPHSTSLFQRRTSFTAVVESMLHKACNSITKTQGMLGVWKKIAVVMCVCRK